MKWLKWIVTGLGIGLWYLARRAVTTRKAVGPTTPINTPPHVLGDDDESV